MSGKEVKELQQLLKQFPGIYPEGLITGYFGSLTEAAVQRLQKIQGIVSYGTAITTGYGQVGPKTRSKLNSLLIEQEEGVDIISLENKKNISPSATTTPSTATTTPVD